MEKKPLPKSRDRLSPQRIRGHAERNPILRHYSGYRDLKRHMELKKRRKEKAEPE